jgi:hypothetical protein
VQRRAIWLRLLNRRASKSFGRKAAAAGSSRPPGALAKIGFYTLWRRRHESGDGTPGYRKPGFNSCR